MVGKWFIASSVICLRVLGIGLVIERLDDRKVDSV